MLEYGEEDWPCWTVKGELKAEGCYHSLVKETIFLFSSLSVTGQMVAGQGKECIHALPLLLSLELHFLKHIYFPHKVMNFSPLPPGKAALSPRCLNV